MGSRLLKTLHSEGYADSKIENVISLAMNDLPGLFADAQANHLEVLRVLCTLDEDESIVATRCVQEVKKWVTIVACNFTLEAATKIGDAEYAASLMELGEFLRGNKNFAGHSLDRAVIHLMAGAKLGSARYYQIGVRRMIRFLGDTGLLGTSHPLLPLEQRTMSFPMQESVV